MVRSRCLAAARAPARPRRGDCGVPNWRPRSVIGLRLSLTRPRGLLVLPELPLQRPEADAEDFRGARSIASGLLQGAEDRILLDVLHAAGRARGGKGGRPAGRGAGLVSSG